MHSTEAVRACSQTIITVIVTVYKQHGPPEVIQGLLDGLSAASPAPMQPLGRKLFDSNGEAILITLAKIRS